MKQLHSTQLEILKKLLFVSSARYSDLKPEQKMENNKFQFHLDTLVESGYVVKTEEGYQLTAQGKEYAGRIDTEGKTRVIKQTKVGAFVCPIRTNEDGEKEVLMYTRLKQPFYGFQGFMSGKIEYGETIQEGARRELNEETGLDGDVEIVGIRHYLTVDEKTQEVLEDKLIFWCRVIDPVGEIMPTIEGEFFWVKVNDIAKVITQTFDSIEELVVQAQTYVEFDGNVTFKEIRHETAKF